ncbi:hypothetical protein SLG_17790 [Sphingobium sp. SYK-6]|uniref:hypothetical protein n=1 Tax=Sphingobium sp. (strain NBRC 103272 / SYK-6) TaxID=627192 RepID=UPI0002277230|nr:hypothetical protein [Sphingobium sp. SYK-6]BAK66454.1 hypothetical protein SLG_17790 [Sphingobium sp. SYK-6]
MRFNRPLLLAGLSALALALPVLAQSGPESLLPEGFGEPAPTPSAPPARNQPAPPPSTPSTSTPTPLLSATSAIDQAANAMQAPDNAAQNAAQADEIAEKYDLPPTARRSLDVIGPLTPELGGLDRAAFGQTHGQALASIMRATRAPFMSRWASILLRRALISQIDTPGDINGADWVAERAWLLLRMGEADNARLLVQGVDSDQYTRRLYSVAMQTQLATADPAGFCPLLPRARDFSDEPGWFMAQAICASFSADQGSASALLNQASRRGIARGIDYRLAEKVVGAGPNSRRSVRIEWDGVDRLTTWRFGLATATNVEIPAALYATVGPQVRAWEARAPGLTPAQRLPGTAVATRLGVFSGRTTLGFHAALAEDDDGSESAELLRNAYGANSIRGRIDAMREFWRLQPADRWPAGPGEVHFGALPVIARAAAALPPTAGAGEDTPWLVAAMLSGGYDRNAARWAAALGRLEGHARERTWALLATGLPAPAFDMSAGRIESFVSATSGEGELLGGSLVAALAGLDRLPVDARDRLLQGAGIDPVPRRRWSRSIMASAQRGERGTVALLAAVGMQGQNWQAMTPQQLYFIIAALRQVGLDPYARMIAAEAMARL